MTDGLLVRNAVIVDGSGAEPFPGDALILGGKIEAVGSVAPPEGCPTLDAGGRCLTPGFVDAHRHADLQVFAPGFGAAELCQGITSMVSGNCGMSAAPCAAGRERELYRYLEPCLGSPPELPAFRSFGEYVQELSNSPLPLNAGAFVGNGSIRIAVKGFDPSPMTAREMDRAVGHVAEAMDAGAVGLSLGLMYAPECFYSQEELVKLARAAGGRGGLLAAHIRGEGGSLVSSVAEAIEIARRAEAPLNVSHFKAAGRGNWGRVLREAIELVERARGRGQDVTCDAYPYAAGSTMLLTLLPPALLAGGVGAALKALESAAARGRLREELSRPHGDWDNLMCDLGWENVVVSSASRPENARCIGKSIRQIAGERCEDEVDCLCDILISEEGGAGMVIHSMSLEDVQEVLRLPWCSVVSDAIYPPSGNPHPRLYGAFPRVIREFVRERRALTLPEAVAKMTSQPARRVGLAGRGLIRRGYAADLLLFRPENVADEATYEDPKRLARGFDYVFIGGRAAILDGKLQNGKYGTYLERRGSI
jgi:N-acyl-D-aspartate/D-glutamate deacylase